MTASEQLFIIGAPRSGTTFLASLLESTRYGTPVESHFITKYAALLEGYGDLNEIDRFSRLLRDILAERPVMQWKLAIDATALHAHLRNQHGTVRFADLVDALFLSRQSRQGHSAWGDKTPHYLGNVDILDSLFPTARYLYIVRDGRDVALSLLHKDWGPNNVFTAAEYWTRLNAPSETLVRLRETDRLHFLRYEDLSNDVDGHIRRIADFLGESLHDEDIARLASTVRSNNSYKWKHALKTQQVKAFDSVAGDTLLRLGYEADPEAREPSYLRRWGFRLHDRAMWSVFMFRTNIIDGFRIHVLGKEPFAD